MRIESLVLILIVNSTQPQFFQWSCFLGLSKLWQKEENSVIWFLCLSAPFLRINRSAVLLFLLCLCCSFYIQHSNFSVLPLSHLVLKSPEDQTPFASDWASVPCFQPQETVMKQHLSLTEIKCIWASLGCLTTASSTMACWSTVCPCC